MRKSVIENIEKYKVIAILRGLSVDESVNVSRALYEGGVKLVEVTFNQNSSDNYAQTINSIRSIKKELGEKMCVGAGTVITLEQLNLAKKAGAEFIVSPDTDEDVIRETVNLGMVSLPGAYTPTEVKLAHKAGADFIKIFPCSDVGYLKAIKAPLSHIKFMAVGGVNSDNASDFIKAGACGVGSALTNKNWIANKRYDLIRIEAEKISKNVLSTEK